MSEEQKIQEEQKCSCKKLTVLVIITLVFSIGTFILSLLNALATPNNATAQAPAPQANKAAVVISKQYDKGQSFAKAKDTKKPMIVFFYTDWCGFCQRFAPTFHKVTTKKEIKKNFAIAYVNCDMPENREYITDFKVEGFPTVFVIDTDGNKTQLENPSFFVPDAEKQLPVKMLEVIGK